MRATRPKSTRVIDMAYVIFGGDMFVTAFMVGLAIWLSLRENDARIDAAARIPLEDEPADG
jgi:hypothetical protein